MVFQGNVLGTTARPIPRLKSTASIKETCNNNSKRTKSYAKEAILSGEGKKREAEQLENKRCYALRSLKLLGSKTLFKVQP